MKNTNKILLAAAVMLQLAGTLCADAWTDAFALFGGPAAVQAQQGSLKISKTQAIIGNQKKTPEISAIAIYVTDENPTLLARNFPNAASQNDLQAALQAANPVAPVQQVAAAPIMSAPQQASNAPANSNSGYASNWLGNSSASSDAAAKAAQKADILAISSQSEELQNIATSGQEGVNLYCSYIDAVFNVFQQALNAVLNPSDAQKLVQYIQKSAANLSVSAAKSNANVLGQMGGSSKKNSNKNSKSTKNKNKK